MRILHEILQSTRSSDNDVQSTTLEGPDLGATILTTDQQSYFHELVPCKALDGFIGDLCGEFTGRGDHQGSNGVFRQFT